MDSVGFLFRKYREKRNLTIEQVSDATHISKEYIRAIEDNYYDELPGNTYCVGFIRNLARFYDADPQYMLDLFNRSKPLNLMVASGSTSSPGRNNLPFFLCGLIIFIFVAAVIFFVPKLGKEKEPEILQPAAAGKVPQPVAKGTEYPFRDAFLERKFFENDTVTVFHGDMEYDIVIRQVKESVVFGFNSGETRLLPGSDVSFDLNGDGNNDIRIIIKETDETEHSVIARFDKALEAPAESKYAEAVSVAPSVIKHSQGTTVIMTSSVVRPLAFTVSFSGPCYFMSDADSRGRDEKFCREDDSIRLEADKNIKLWMSDSGFVKAKLKEHEIFFGNRGEVSVVEIGWEEAAEGQYNLSVKTVR